LALIWWKVIALSDLEGTWDVAVKQVSRGISRNYWEERVPSALSAFSANSTAVAIVAVWWAWNAIAGGIVETEAELAHEADRGGGTAGSESADCAV
jgi:hypothetical protein